MNLLPVEPAWRLADRAEDQRWLVTGLWSEQAVGIIGGEPKCCKSFLAHPPMSHSMFFYWVIRDPWRECRWPTPGHRGIFPKSYAKPHRETRRAGFVRTGRRFREALEARRNRR
ncbi:MAG TPA: hypothetical protein VJY15_18080 [Candidatus Acidoferrum sp.]|nr:hypothetical protein [Candidatus Acidoferrum sp.]